MSNNSYLYSWPGGSMQSTFFFEEEDDIGTQTKLTVTFADSRMQFETEWTPALDASQARQLARWILAHVEEE